MDVCTTCGANQAHPTLLACIEWLKGRYDTLTIELSDARTALEQETERHEQIMLNDAWLRDRLNDAHHALCPELCGTWQQRATQLVDAARRIANTPKPDRR